MPRRPSPLSVFLLGSAEGGPLVELPGSRERMLLLKIA